MSEASIPPAPIRSNEFWFDDGDIVLSVTNDGIEHHFCVHRPILIIASPVFRDMLSLPQPSSDDESLPISLQGDSVQDITALLGALYTFRKVQKMTFDVALGILRLSHKYQIEGLEEAAKLRLLEDWPLKHSDYIARLGSLGSRVLQASRLIEAAQRCQANNLLPVAFYELACAWDERFVDISRELSPENVTRLFLGLTRIKRRYRTLNRDTPMSKYVVPTSIGHYRLIFPRCQQPNTNINWNFSPNQTVTCPSMFSAFQKKLAEGLFKGDSVLDMLQQFSRDDLSGTCVPCKDWFMSVMENKTVELWENIPADFDLPKVVMKYK